MREHTISNGYVILTQFNKHYVLTDHFTEGACPLLDNDIGMLSCHKMYPEVGTYHAHHEYTLLAWNTVGGDLNFSWEHDGASPCKNSGLSSR